MAAVKVDDLICVQLGGARGRWHVSAPRGKTACGLDVGLGQTYRYLDLIDSKFRCKSEGCIRARLAHKGIS